VRYGSVCSGIEAATVAWHGLGWEAAWFSEIEPFPCAVLAHHYPTVANLGDMTLLPERIRSGEVEAPDILCGGTPCQAFSVAGQRQSLADARGNLTLTFVEIADAIDAVRRAAGHKPSIVVWENVPGVLNTADNAFGCFLAGVAGESVPLEPPGGKWTDAGAVYGPARTIAWRILNAEHFGLAQRRKRVFVVASARDDFDPAAVLFEWGGVRRDTAPSREAGQGAAAAVGRCFAGGRESDVAATLETTAHDYSRADGFTVVAFDSTQITSRANRSNPQAGDPCHPLAAGAHAPANAFHPIGSNPIHSSDGTTHAMTCGSAGGSASVAVCVDLYNGTITGDCAPTVTTQGGGPNTGPSVMHAMAVRRLTPRECERLQGFPDDYTAIPWRKKPAADCPDGPRYKALGNSWAVPVVRWIGQRIAEATNRQSPPTVGATA
jgi:DNA (cytosine-5)-methyltransferase 1